MKTFRSLFFTSAFFAAAAANAQFINYDKIAAKKAAFDNSCAKEQVQVLRKANCPGGALVILNACGTERAYNCFGTVCEARAASGILTQPSNYTGPGETAGRYHKAVLERAAVEFNLPQAQIKQMRHLDGRGQGIYVLDVAGRQATYDCAGSVCMLHNDASTNGAPGAGLPPTVSPAPAQAATPAHPLAQAAPTAQPAATAQAQPAFLQARPPSVDAPDPDGYKGKFFLQPSLGIGNLYKYTGSTTTVPPLMLTGEYFISDNISLGGVVGYTSCKYTIDDGYSYNAASLSISYLLLAARGTYTLPLESVRGLSLYLPVMLGYNSGTVKGKGGVIDGTDITVSGGVFGVGVGARYMFSDHAGAFAELGYSYCLMNVGASFKF